VSRTERPWAIQTRGNFSFDADGHPLFAPSDGLSGMTIARRHMLQASTHRCERAQHAAVFAMAPLGKYMAQEPERQF
jgi:hypothetical protein